MHLFQRRGLPLAVLLSALVCGAGCESGATDDLPRNGVSGTITLDGQPLAKGLISFDPDKGQADAVSAGAVVTEGSYSIARNEGLTPGKYRVSIRSSAGGESAATKEAPGMPPKKREKDPIPEKYNAKTTLSAEVTEGGSNVFDFELTSK
jgi:hypothetical protein